MPRRRGGVPAPPLPIHLCIFAALLPRPAQRRRLRRPQHRRRRRALRPPRRSATTTRACVCRWVLPARGCCAGAGKCRCLPPSSRSCILPHLFAYVLINTLLLCPIQPALQPEVTNSFACRAGACTTARTAPRATSAGRRRLRPRPSAPSARSTSAPSGLRLSVHACASCLVCCQLVW